MSGERPTTTSRCARCTRRDLGVNFIDTADVYGDGHSERLVARFRRERSEPIIVATKAGRRLQPHIAADYNRANLTAFVERSLQNLDTEAIDLLQLHCPPTRVYQTPDVFGILDDLQQAGKLRFYGVSVERAQEAFLARRVSERAVGTDHLQYFPHSSRPSSSSRSHARSGSECSRACRSRVACSPGKLSQPLAFSDTDHRNFNRHGESFDVGETFCGVDYDDGLARGRRAARRLVPAGANMAQLALRWILMFPEVTAAIPGRDAIRSRPKTTHERRIFRRSRPSSCRAPKMSTTATFGHSSMIAGNTRARASAGAFSARQTSPCRR